MFKKLLVVLIASVFLIAFSHQALAFVQGEWNVNVIEKISAKVKKVAVTKYTDDFSDTWSFSADGQFAIDGMPLGTWGIVKKKFVVYLDAAVLNVILADNLQDAGFPGDTAVTITATKASGTMKKDGSIKGTYKVVALVSTSGVTGKMTVNGKFAGIKISDGDNPPDDETEFAISEYFPPGQGNTWTYVEEDEELTVRAVSGTEQVNGVNALKIIDEDGDYNLWTNSDGLLFHKIYNADDVPGCGWSQLIFNPPIKVSDPVVSVGSTSASTSTLFYTDCSGSSATSPISYEITIEGVEDVTVPAGTFNDCLKVRFVLTMNGGADINEDTSWLAKGLGTVKSISISRQNGSVVGTWTEDLVSAVVDGVSYP